MLTALKELASSKKALATLAATGVSLLAKLGFDISTEELMPILAPLVAYIIGQGIADNGKSAAKIKDRQDNRIP